MKKIKGYVHLSGLLEEQQFSFDVSDDATDFEIENIAREIVLDTIHWGWWEEDEK